MYCIEIHQIRFKKKNISIKYATNPHFCSEKDIYQSWLMCLGARFRDDPLVIGILKSPMQWDSQFTLYFALINGIFRYITYITFQG